MTALDLMYAIAARAKDLAGKRIPELRLMVATANTLYGALREEAHKSRGDLIEEILCEEFEDQGEGNRWRLTQAIENTQEVPECARLVH